MQINVKLFTSIFSLLCNSSKLIIHLTVLSLIIPDAKLGHPDLPTQVGSVMHASFVRELQGILVQTAVLLWKVLIHLYREHFPELNVNAWYGPDE